MTQADRYFIGPGLRDKLRDVIRRVDGGAYGGGGGEIPTRLQDMGGRGGGGGSGILSKTTDTWAIDTSQELCVYAGDPPGETATSQTVTAWNKFAEIPAGNWVFLSRANGHWYVVAAQCVPPEEPSPP